MHMRLHYAPLLVGVNAVVPITDTTIGGFFCTTAGSINITGTDDFGNVVTIVATTAVAAGQWYFLPFYLGPKGAVLTASGGASGTLAA